MYVHVCSWMGLMYTYVFRHNICIYMWSYMNMYMGDELTCMFRNRIYVCTHIWTWGINMYMHA